MKKLILSLFFLFIYLPVFSQLINKRTGIEIHFDIDDNTFPLSWQGGEINAQGTPLDSEEFERSLDLLTNALNKYPTEVIRSNLKKVYILKEIKFYGIGYGGTNSTDIVYMTNNGVADGYTDHYIEQTFHHEFSSILLRNFPHYINKNSWVQLNQLEYGKGGVQALRDSNDSMDIDSVLNEKGFLYQYAASDFENDFNSFAENLFAPSEKFKKVVHKYQALSEKLELIIRFYNLLDSSLTFEYFTKLMK